MSNLHLAFLLALIQRLRIAVVFLGSRFLSSPRVACFGRYSCSATTYDL